MKPIKIIIALLLIIGALVITFLIFDLKTPKKANLSPIQHPPIDLSEDDSIIFYEGGFTIVGKEATYFSDEGLRTYFPFSGQGIDGQHFNITDITVNFMLVNGRDIYKVEGNSLKRIYVLEAPAIAIKEFGDYLILYIDNNDGEIVLQYLDIENTTLSDLALDNDFVFLDLSCSEDNTGLSVLTLDVSGSYPSSKVLHYDKKISLQGFLSLKDQLLYRIYRLSDDFLLVGNHDLVCYNKEGDIKWAAQNKGTGSICVIPNNSELLVYFEYGYKADGDRDQGNGIFIDDQGNYRFIQMPAQLTNILPYNKNFIAIGYGNRIIVLDKNGKVKKEYSVEIEIKDLYVNPFKNDYIYIVDNKNILQVFSLKTEHKNN
ncbi:MAG: hypothetical protein GX352_06815 [Clostridiales bacterium]|nr:hypothetical protein [Clostridiales bacterium]